MGQTWNPWLTMPVVLGVDLYQQLYSRKRDSLLYKNCIVAVCVLFLFLMVPSELV